VAVGVSSVCVRADVFVPRWPGREISRPFVRSIDEWWSKYREWNTAAFASLLAFG